MNEHFRFFNAFLKNPLNVGAIVPSSPELARKMCEGIKPDKNNIVLEIGVGTGAITKEIKKILPNKESYLGIEINKNFMKMLRRDFYELNFVNASATEAFEIHRRERLGKVRYIISGLPFASLPKLVSQDIIREVEKFMSHGCLFRTFQYAHGYTLPPAINFRKQMETKFGKMTRSNLVWKNVPPAYTLTWKI
jgi:phospholipid N-methyltransferase